MVLETIAAFSTPKYEMPSYLDFYNTPRRDDLLDPLVVLGLTVMFSGAFQD